MIFIDTGAFVARYLKNDQHHEKAKKLWHRITSGKMAFITSSFILDETLTLLGRRAGNRFAAERGERIYASKRIRILRPERQDELNALKTFVKYSDQHISFTDCISFELMKKLKIKRAFSFDKHFESAGFILID